MNSSAQYFLSGIQAEPWAGRQPHPHNHECLILGLERRLRGWKRTQVQFPPPTWQFTTVRNPALNDLTPSSRDKCRQNANAHKMKINKSFFIKSMFCLDPQNKERGKGEGKGIEGGTPFREPPVILSQM